MPVWNPRANALFAAAVELGAPDERRAYLDRECPDAGLRHQVESLLAAHAAAGSFLEPKDADPGTAAYADPATGAYADPDAVVGTVIAGKYKLLEVIGEGGMGSVFMAQQTEPVKRRVAVKVIKAGMDSRQVLARFEAERQALALMDHPNIAKVLDAGTTESGSPYFVMELVKGTPITKFCDERKLSPRERLELFVPVCHAIQHAHQKGIIHRDVKPSNVLVALYDDRPVPKVIDFGVAKATGQQLAAGTLVTGLGVVVGTAEYMSPEQAGVNNLDIDTRSDVYALGVLLYELLTGSTPVDRKSLGQAALLEILRIVREVEPPTPSRRLSTADALPSIAANRRTEPTKLTRLLRGELDWVVMKALEKDRARRYETANGLARDIQRYLADEVVEARPPSAGYRLRKFVRRNKGRVIAAGLVFLALVGGVVGTTLGLFEAKRQRDAAEVARAREAGQRQAAEQAATAERLAREQAQMRLTQIEKANAILGSIFKDLNPHAAEKEGKPLQVLLGERLDGATAQLEGEAIGDPLAVARMQLVLGESQLGLGYPEKAIGLFGKARSTLTAQLGPDDPLTLDSMSGLARGYEDAGKLDLALPLYEETLRLQKAKLGPDHPDTLTSMGNLALVYLAAKEPGKAIPLFGEFLAGQKKRLGDGPRLAGVQASVAQALLNVGQAADAEPVLRECLAIREKAEPDAWTTFNTRSVLGAALLGQQKYAEAEPLLVTGYEGMKQRADTIPPQGKVRLPEAAGRLAELCAATGRPAEAAKWLDELWAWAEAGPAAKP